MKKKVKFERKGTFLDTVREIATSNEIPNHHVYVKEIDYGRNVATLVYTKHLGSLYEKSGTILKESEEKKE